MVWCVHNPIEHGVTHVEVSGGHINLRSEHPRAFWELAAAHPMEQIKVLFD
jgi:hypothetical protein